MKKDKNLKIIERKIYANRTQKRVQSLFE
jgi:hypothetical protein